MAFDPVGDFVSQYGDIAAIAGERIGVSPNLILAQLGHETGWGKSIIPGTNNLGNIKDFSGRGVSATDNMTGSRDRYRSYETPEAFADDFASLLVRKYKGVIDAGDDVDQFTRALVSGGYAEDKNYANKIKNALNKVNAAEGKPTNSSVKVGVDWSQFSPVDNTPTGKDSSVDWSLFSPVDISEPKKPESSSSLRRIADVGISAAKGVIGVPEAIVGLADIPTGGYAGKIAEDIGFRPKDAKAFLDEGLSPEQQAANKKVADAKGFFPTIAASLENPSTIGHTVVESLPAMGAGGVIGRALGATAKVAPWLGGAIGEGTVGAGQAAEQIRQETKNRLLTPSQSAMAVASGIGTGAFNAAGGRLAQKLGISDIDTMLAGGPAGTSQKGLFRRMLEGGISEGAFEEMPQSMQEQVWQNLALGKPAMEGVSEAGAKGLLAGAAMGGGANILHGNVNPTNNNPATEPPVPTLALGNTPDPIIGFPDGSAGRRSDVEKYINSLPEERRIEARAKLLNMAPQPTTPTVTDIQSSQSLDEALAKANDFIDAPITTPEIKAPIAADMLASAVEPSLVSQLDTQPVIPTESQIQRQENIANTLSAAPRPAQDLILPSQPVAQSIEAPKVPMLDRQLEARRKLASGELLTSMEAALAKMPLPVSSRAQDIALPERTSARQKGLPDVQSTASLPIRNDSPASVAGTAQVQPDTKAGLPPVAQPDSVRQANTKAPAPVDRNGIPAANVSVESAPALTNKTQSWVIREKTTGKVIMETFDQKKVDALNTQKYEAVPIGEHLASLNTGETYRASRESAPALTPRQAEIARVKARKENPLSVNLPKGSIAGGSTEISKLHDDVRAERIPSTEKRAVRFAEVEADEAAKLKAATGLDLVGYKHSVDTFGIRHSYSEHGGDAEIKRGQLPISKEDFERIPEIIANPDKIELIGKDAMKQDLIRYTKRFNGTTYYVEEVRNKRMELATKTLWKTRTRESMSETPKLTPEALGGNQPQGTDSIASDQQVGKVADIANSESPGELQNQAPLFSKTTAASQAETILDAADITGAERINALKDVKSGAITVEELGAAYPAKPLQSKASTRESSKFLDQWETDAGLPIYFGKKFDLKAVKEYNTESDFESNGLQLGQTAEVADGNKVYDFVIKDSSGKVVGDAVLQVDRGGYIVAIHDIEAFQKNTGIGTEVVSNIVASTNGPVRVIQIVPTAEKFWESVGAHGRDQYNHSSFTWQSFAQSDRGRARRVAQESTQESSGERSESRRGDGEAQRGTEGTGSERLNSVSNNPTSGIRLDALDKSLATLRNKWQGFTAVNTVQSVSDLPASLREFADATTEGLYDPATKQVYLIADNLYSSDRAIFVAAHEVLGHGGLRMLQDKSVTQAVNIASGNKFIKALAKAIESDRGSSAFATEEAMAELAAAIETGNFKRLENQYGVEIPLSARNGIAASIARVIEAVRKFIANAMGKAVTDVSDADVRALLTQAREAVEGNATGSENDLIGAALASTRAEQVDSATFKKWFGDSKVVDADGKPMVMYHGTAKDFDAFDNSKTGANDMGLWGRGHYFASTPTSANSYALRQGDGARVIQAYVSIQNPLVLRIGDDLVTRLRDGTNTRDLIGQNLDGSKIKAIAMDGGHDGVIQIKPNGSIGDVVAFRPAQIKSAIGNNGDFDAGNENILFSNKSIVGDSGRDYTPEQRGAFTNTGREIEKPTFNERIANLWKDAGKKMAQGLVDQFAPIKDLSTEAYALMRLSKGASGAFETFLRGGRLKLSDGVYDFDDTKKGGVVEKLLTPLQGEHDDFMWWVAANRAEKLSTEDREHLFSAADIAAIKSLDSGATKFDYTLKHGANAGRVTRDRTLIYRDSLATFNEFHKNALDMAEQSGMIDSASRPYWESEFYVPFYRVSEEDDAGVRGMNIKSGVVRQQAFKKLKGGTDKINGDLLENTMMNWAHLLDAAAKNRAAKSSLEAAERMGIATETNSVTKKTVWFMENGQKRYFLVDDPYIMEAIQGLEYAGMRGPLMDAMGAMKHALTIGVTASPFFKVKNLIRDSVQAIGMSPLSYNVTGNMKQGFALTDPKSDAYFRLLAGGGTIHFGTMMEGSEARRVRALVKSGVNENSILTNEAAYKRFYHQMIEPSITAYNELGNRGEAINRAALYDQLIKQGKSHAEASLLARDLMDFSMQGAWTSVRFLTQVVPFLNARMQGLYKLGRSAKEDPQKFGVVLGAVAMASIALMLAYSDDDDWKKREDWDRDTFWWFKIGGQAFRIPKPFEIGAIGTLAERGVELFTSKEMTGERFKKRLLNLLSENLSLNPVPQMVKPILDVYSNKDAFTGRPIESMGMENLKSDYRFNQRTSMTARATSTAANAVTGIIGKEALSPVQIDHMIRGYFGWLGTFIVGSVDVVAKPVTDQPGGASRDWWKFLTGGMVSDANSPSSRYISQMYEQAKVIEEAHGTWRMMLKEGKAAEAKEFFDDNKDKLLKYRSIESIKRTEAKLNERIRIIERSNKDGDEKRDLIQQIQKQKDQIARRIAA